MALFDVKFNVLNGGLGRTLAGDDSVSGLVSGDDKPSGSTKTIQVNSLNEAEKAGITATGFPQLHYHIANFYDQVSAQLFITFTDGDFAQDLHDLQAEADNKIKQIAVIENGSFSTASLATLNTAAVQASAEHKGYSVLYTAEFAGLTLATLPDLTSYAYPKVSVIIGSDASHKAYTAIGAALGVVASAKVSQCIGWVRAFDVVKTGEFETLGFATG